MPVLFGARADDFQKQKMHYLPVIVKLNEQAAARVRGQVAAQNHSTKLRQLKDSRAERERKLKCQPT